MFLILRFSYKARRVKGVKSNYANDTCQRMKWKKGRTRKRIERKGKWAMGQVGVMNNMPRRSCKH